MPDQRLKKARESLPSGYQFGDAGKPAIRIRFLKSYDIRVDPKPQRIYQSDDGAIFVTDQKLISCR